MLAATDYEQARVVAAPGDGAIPGTRTKSLHLKRWLDVIVSVVALTLLSPFILLIALWIRLDSSGPVFFRQLRIGKGGRPFQIWKFRTMRCDVSDQRHRDLVVPLVRAAVARQRSPSRAPLPPDPRITRAGKWLRRTSLDEVPQLLNVLAGDMSLVGPRPPVVYEYEHFDDRLRGRSRMSPGMTGLWQVTRSDRLDFGRMYDLDLEYVQKWSLRLDLEILAKTLPVVLLGDRA